jgi:prophage antirepressor-like protein
MDNMQVYKHEQFGEIRTLTKNGEIWFVAADVCNVLDLTNPTMAVARLDEDERSKFNLGRQGMTNCVNEYGLYNLILASRKKEAKVFKRWITHEVLPDIRRHGAYMTPAKLEEVLLNPDTIIQLATELKRAQEERDALSIRNSELTVQNTVMQPKADYFDELVDRNLLSNFRNTAKALGVKQKEFINYLLDHGYVYRDAKGTLFPYAEKNDGLFEIKECYNEKTSWKGYQTLITLKGRETFRLLLEGGLS